MQGATPAMPKEQALAWCEDKVDSGADLKVEQARLDGALSDAMQPKTYTMNGFTNCNSIGSNTNCNTTGYATPMPSYNSGQYGQAMGAALGAAFARPGEIKKCMAMLGYSEIEVEQNVKTPKTQSALRYASNGNTINGEVFFANVSGWEITGFKNNGITEECTAVYIPPVGNEEKAVFFTVFGKNSPYNLDDKFAVGIVDLNLVHPDKRKVSVNLEIGNSVFQQQSGVVEGSRMMTSLYKSLQLIDEIETSGHFELDAGVKYKFDLPNARGLMNDLHNCANASLANIPALKPSYDNKMKQPVQYISSSPAGSVKEQAQKVTDAEMQIWADKEVQVFPLSPETSSFDLTTWTPNLWRGVTKFLVGHLKGPAPFIEFPEYKSNHLEVGDFVKGSWIKAEWLVLGGPFDGNGVTLLVPNNRYGLMDFLYNEKHRCKGQWSEAPPHGQKTPNGMSIESGGGECFDRARSDKKYVSSYVVIVEPSDQSHRIAIIGRRYSDRSIK